MTDTIIKGTGNSRFLKSVPNFMALYPTFEAFGQALADGTLPVDLGPMNAAGVDVFGTNYSKAAVLPDTLCTALGLATSATPAQALEKLRTLVNTVQTTANGRCQIAAGSYVGTGTCGVDNPNSISFPFQPKLVIMTLYGFTSGSFKYVQALQTQSYGYMSTFAVDMNSLSTDYLHVGGGFYQSGYGASTNNRGKKSADGKTLYWYSTKENDAIGQCNTAGYTYYYTAIG